MFSPICMFGPTCSKVHAYAHAYAQWDFLGVFAYLYTHVPSHTHAHLDPYMGTPKWDLSPTGGPCDSQGVMEWVSGG